MTSIKNIHLLLDDYAGRVSEMTAITQYLHHYLVVEEEDVAQLLEEIAIQEMEHLEELGHTLEEANIDPRFWDANKSYWRGDYVDYQYDVCDILRSDIQGELDAIFQYYQHIHAIPSDEVDALLQEIIEDELSHIGRLMEKLALYCSNFNPNEWLRNQVNLKPFDIKFKTRLLQDLRL